MQEPQETWVQSLGWEGPLEEEMATYSSILAWEIPWTEDPGRLQSMGNQRARHNWVSDPASCSPFSEGCPGYHRSILHTIEVVFPTWLQASRHLWLILSCPPMSTCWGTHWWLTSRCSSVIGTTCDWDHWAGPYGTFPGQTSPQALWMPFISRKTLAKE